MHQTPINNIHNPDVLHLMRPNYRRVIEVGSSSGALAQAYRARNPAVRYTGIEIDADYADASRRHCSDVLVGNIERFPPEVFAGFADADCWIFADVLEHLYNPWELLARIRTGAGGPVEVIACIPNAQHWSLQACMNGGHYVYQDSGLLDRTHIRWFTRITILQLFAEAGFRVEAMTARNAPPPSREVLAAVGAMAAAVGGDPEIARQDCVPFQYVVRAVAS